jgi:hypothetical protein
MWLTHVSVRREFLKLTEDNRRYAAGNAQNFDAGNNANKGKVFHNGLEIKTDKDLPYGIVFGVNKGHLFWVPEVEGEWADEDGAILARAENKDVFEARYRLIDNFFSDKGSSQIRMDGVTATVTAGVFAD